jgi:DNA-binding winged helix-turn-helix (wHTH) protein/TolB-like protein/tetratricopeptide (TPR) repeat protein
LADFYAGIVMEEGPTIYQFDDVQVDLKNFKVFKAGRAVHLEPKAIKSLIFLIEHRGRLIEKSELLDAVWQDAFVTENAMTKVIAKLRKTLGDGIKEAKYIETVPTRGYRFIADVEVGKENVETGARAISLPHKALEGDSSLQIGGKLARLTRRVKRVGWRSLLACTLLIGLLISGYFWTRQSKVPVPAAPSATIKSVAVLPFKPLVAVSRDESLEIGIADSLITRLGGIKGIVVRPISAVRKYVDLEQDPVAAGRELSVESVLEGSIQKVDDRIRVTVRLLSVPDGKSLWAEKFDNDFTDIFTIQDRVAEQVARSLKLTLTGEEKKLLSKHNTDYTDAYQLYLKGRFTSSTHTEERTRKAIEYFNQAIETDPNYALAYAGLADAYYGLSELYLPPKEAMPKARAAAMKALEIDESLAEAHTSLALVKTFYEWDWSGAEREYQRAIELNPNYAMAHEWYGWHLALTGRHDESIAEVRRAQQIDPVSIDINWSLGVVFYFARQYDKAIKQLQTTLEMDSTHRLAHFHLGASFFQKGMYEEAVAEFEKEKLLAGGHLSAALGYTYGVTGRRDEAEEILRGLKERSKRHFVSSNSIALVYTGLGEKDLAFEWLEKAYQERSELMTWLKVDPRLDSLRSESRFTDLMRRVGLTPWNERAKGKNYSQLLAQAPPNNSMQRTRN